jgi:hypothetical protein
MYIQYTYKQITNANQVHLIIDDIKQLLCADTSTSELQADKEAQLTAIIAASTVANPLECKFIVLWIQLGLK